MILFVVLHVGWKDVDRNQGQEPESRESIWWRGKANRSQKWILKKLLVKKRAKYKEWC